jgi:tungstate transport system substrate-binding protein
VRTRLGVLPLALALAGPASAAPPLTLVSTTTTRDSGLLDHLLPRFEAESGISVRVISVGTGQALALGRRGDADVLLVHDRASEDAFVAEGFALARRDVMYNDFVLVGPAADPAGVAHAARIRPQASSSPVAASSHAARIRSEAASSPVAASRAGLADASAALARIAKTQAAFVSRGDESGTHQAELRLWQQAGFDPRAASGTWYRETGSGMGPTLATANELAAYTLTDRGTWLAFRRRGALVLFVEGGAALRNAYGVLVVNPARHPHVQVEQATRFADWITSAAGREAIESFRIDGEVAFHAAP